MNPSDPLVLGRTGTAPSADPETLLAPWAGSLAPAYFRDPAGTLLAANPAFRRKFGWARKDGLPGQLLRLVHPEDLAPYLETAEKLARPPHRTLTSHRWQTPQGWRWLAWEESITFGADDQPLGVLAVGQDITRQKIAEELWLKLSRAVEQCPVGIAIADAAGRAQYVNPKYAATVGRSLEEILDSNWQVLRDGHPDEAAYQEFLSRVRAGHEWSGHLNRVTADGSTVWESVQVSSIRGPRGEITNLLCVREDITAQKRLEESLRRNQPTEALAAQAGKLAHDFNNLIAVIDGYAALLANGSSDAARTARYLAQIAKTSRKAIELTAHLRALTEARIPAPADPTEPAAPAGRETILVVDDEEILREVLRAALTPLGYQILTAASAAEAVAAVHDRAQTIDAVFLDLHMPGGSGAGVMQTIRTHRPFAPVIIVSGADEGEVREAIGGDPLADSLAKPYRIKQAVELLRQLLDRSKSARLA
jgi:PAS domain S-box-containing protein